jgi:hypothetical protein
MKKGIATVPRSFQVILGLSPYRIDSNGAILLDFRQHPRLFAACPLDPAESFWNDKPL